MIFPVSCEGVMNSAKYTLTVCFGDGFFGCEQPESSSFGPADWFVVTVCSLFLLVGCDDPVFAETSFLVPSTLSDVVDVFFFFSFFFVRFSASSPSVLLWTMVLEDLPDVDVPDFAITLL